MPVATALAPRAALYQEVAERLQDIGIEALTVHGRTRVQMYKGDADWRLIAKIKENPRIRIPIFGNGDIDSPEKAVEYKNRYGVDGIMIGRGALIKPWIFTEIKERREWDISARERLELIRKVLPTLIH